MVAERAHPDVRRARRLFRSRAAAARVPARRRAGAPRNAPRELALRSSRRPGTVRRRFAVCSRQDQKVYIEVGRITMVVARLLEINAALRRIKRVKQHALLHRRKLINVFEVLHGRFRSSVLGFYFSVLSSELRFRISDLRSEISVSVFKVRSQLID